MISTTIRALGFSLQNDFIKKQRTMGLALVVGSLKNGLKLKTPTRDIRPIVRKHKFQRTFVKDLADQIQMDLVDMGKYKNQNKGYYWILTAVEILSRYAFTIPVYRKDTKNMTKAVGELLEEFKERFGKYPKRSAVRRGKRIL